MAVAYPEPADLREMLSRAGIVLSDTVAPIYLDADLQGYLDQSREEFEGACGRAMLADDTHTYTQLLDCNGRNIVPLPGSLARLDSLTMLGLALTEGTDFWLYPQRRGSDGLAKPFEWIQFATATKPLAWNGARQAISVTGAWGYSPTTVPDVAWKGILAGAALLIYPEVSGLRSGGAQAVSEGITKEEFSNRSDAGAYANEFTQWGLQRDRGVKLYRRICTGLGGAR